MLRILATFVRSFHLVASLLLVIRPGAPNSVLATSSLFVELVVSWVTFDPRSYRLLESLSVVCGTGFGEQGCSRGNSEVGDK